MHFSSLLIVLNFHYYSVNLLNIPIDIAFKHLQQYGYINKSFVNPHDEDSKNAQIVVKEFYSALKTYQKTYNLPETGRLDAKTLRLMSTPRCGNKDIISKDDLFKFINITWTNKDLHKRVRRYAVDKDSYWTKRKISYKIQAYPTSGLSKNKVRACFQRALNIWSRETNLDFFEDASSYEADIMILFGKRNHGDAIPFDGPGKVLAHAYFPHHIDVTYSRAGDAHFDDDETWIDGFGKSTGKNLESVAVHELGHSLGMAHSLVKEAIMFPFYVQPESGSIKLHEDDIKGIQSIYGLPPAGKTIPKVPDLPNEYPSLPPVTLTTLAPKNGPDPCQANIDAVLQVRGGELCIFQGRWQWRVGWSKTINNWYSYEHRDGPQILRYYWPILPENLENIDAVYEALNERLYFFKGKRFWILTNNHAFLPGFYENGKSLVLLGLPDYLDKVDAVFRWGYNKRTYIFAGSQYWKLREERGEFGMVDGELRYPRLIRDVWQGVPDNINAIYTGLNGVTYFFKNHQYYEFNDYRMSVNPGYPRPAKLSWLGCKRGDDLFESPKNLLVKLDRKDPEPGSYATLPVSSSVFIVFCLLLVVI